MYIYIPIAAFFESTAENCEESASLPTRLLGGRATSRPGLLHSTIPEKLSTLHFSPTLSPSLPLFTSSNIEDVTSASYFTTFVALSFFPPNVSEHGNTRLFFSPTSAGCHNTTALVQGELSSSLFVGRCQTKIHLHNHNNKGHLCTIHTRIQIICIPFFSVSYVILPQMDFLLFDLRFNTYFCFTSMLTHLLFVGYISSFFSVAVGISRKEAIRIASVVEASFLENNERNGLAEEELSGRSTLAPFCPAPKECKRSAGHESSASRPKR